VFFRLVSQLTTAGEEMQVLVGVSCGQGEFRFRARSSFSEGEFDVIAAFFGPAKQSGQHRFPASGPRSVEARGLESDNKPDRVPLLGMHGQSAICHRSSGELK
jgi:hypothetical protein